LCFALEKNMNVSSQIFFPSAFCQNKAAKFVSVGKTQRCRKDVELRIGFQISLKGKI
jgi:hypothetical protein